MPTVPEMPEVVEFEVMLTNLTVGVPTQGGQIFSPPIFGDTRSWVLNRCIR